MPKQTDLQKLKEQMSLLAERIAREGFKIHLDYSVKSIEQVEHILGKIHDEYKSTKSEEGLQGIAFEFAAYIVKVIEQNFGDVEWQRNHSTIGENTFPLQWRNSTLFPFGWCLKRIYDGKEENLWIKFKVSVVDVT